MNSNKTNKTYNKAAEVLKQIGMPNKPSASGTKLGVHNWLGETENMVIIIEKLKWYEPYSVLRQVRALLYYWANYNLKQTQNLIIMTQQIIENSNYDNNIKIEKQQQEYKKLAELQVVMNENVGS